MYGTARPHWNWTLGTGPIEIIICVHCEHGRISNSIHINLIRRALQMWLWNDVGWPSQKWLLGQQVILSSYTELRDTLNSIFCNSSYTCYYFTTYFFHPCVINYFLAAPPFNLGAFAFNLGTAFIFGVFFGIILLAFVVCFGAGPVSGNALSTSCCRSLDVEGSSCLNNRWPRAKYAILTSKMIGSR